MSKELFKFIIKVANFIIQLIEKLKIAIFLKPKKSKALVLTRRRIISTFLTHYKSQRLKLKRFYFPSSTLPNSLPYSLLWLIVNTIAWKYILVFVCVEAWVMSTPWFYEPERSKNWEIVRFLIFPSSWLVLTIFYWFWPNWF